MTMCRDGVHTVSTKNIAYFKLFRTFATSLSIKYNYQIIPIINPKKLSV